MKLPGDALERVRDSLDCGDGAPDQLVGLSVSEFGGRGWAAHALTLMFLPNTVDSTDMERIKTLLRVGIGVAVLGLAGRALEPFLAVIGLGCIILGAAAVVVIIAIFAFSSN